MTREEAIAILQSMIPTPCRADGKSTTHTLATIALDMAIKALEQQPNLQPTCNQLATDCISRQAVIDRINKLIEVEKKQGTDDWGYGRERVNAYEAMLHFVKSEYLYPSVEPERKPGKWIWDNRTGEYECSECGCNPIYERTTPDCSEIDKYRYCRWCGSPMEVQNGKNDI